MKNKRVIFVLAILLLISTLSISVAINNSSNQKRIRKSMVNNVFVEFTTISQNLEDLLSNIENGITSYEENQRTLITLSCDFTALNTTLKWYDNAFPVKGSSRSSYIGISDFGHIAYTLTTRAGVVNDLGYSGIMMDGRISENEVKYMSILKNDIDIIIQSMASEENPLQESQNLRPYQIDNILDTFFSKWSYRNENSPYSLLQSN